MSVTGGQKVVVYNSPDLSPIADHFVGSTEVVVTIYAYAASVPPLCQLPGEALVGRL